MGRTHANITKTWGSKAIIAAIALIGAGLNLHVPTAHADDPAFVSVAAGLYDWNRQKDEGTEVRIEYRHDEKYLGFLKPFVAAAATDSSNSFFIGAGVLADIYFGKRVVLTPSFAPHYYNGGNEKLDLDYALEFRSQLELAYRFDDRSRLGVAVSHYSNASLGATNPGTESAMVYYSIPVDFFD
ncbi:MAG: acyloxyacyl hydrolase [Magnetovibrio sp.]|nr:acyloxyacyl hydrolase [Magnetovibrio sp.]